MKGAQSGFSGHPLLYLANKLLRTKSLVTPFPEVPCDIWRQWGWLYIL